MDNEPLLFDTGKGLSIKYHNRFLYSKYDPNKNIEKKITTLNLRNKTIYLIPSPLLGYGISFLQEKLPIDSIIIFLEIDKKLLEISNNKNNIFYITNGFYLLDIIKDINFSKFKKCELLSINGSYDLYKSEYDRLYNIILNHLHNYWKNRYTLTQMGQLWIKNSLINLKTLHLAKPLSSLKTSKPIVIIGAGESTESVLEILQKYRKHIYILCVDTALQILLEVDIKPDSVVALEGQFYNLPDFFGAKDLNIDLIYDLSSYPSVPRNLKGDKYYTITEFSKSSLFNIIEESNIIDQYLPPLGSVGITAMYIGLKMTTNNIFLAGLDFSYVLGKTHSKGTPYHKTSLLNWCKTQTGDSYISCLKRPLINKKNKIGKIENTDTILFEYSTYAKELLYGTTRVFDLTKKGLDLGLPIINEETFYDKILIQNIDRNDIISNSNSKDSVEVFNREFTKISSAIIAIESYHNGEIIFNDIINMLFDLKYLFEHYPEENPISLITEKNLNRYYLTLLRFKRIIGK